MRGKSSMARVKKKKESSSGGGYDTPESGFLYKPESDVGGLVILLPSKYRNSQVVIKSPDGEVIEAGRSTGYANGDREHFRFNQTGGSYPSGSVVEVTTSDGSTMRYLVEDTSMRIEAGGATSGGSSEGGMSSSTAAALMGSSSLDIQRPGGGFQVPDGYYFDSPLSTLETIRQVSNIIVGSSKSFDSLSSFANELGISGQEQLKTDLTAIPGYDIDTE